LVVGFLVVSFLQSFGIRPALYLYLGELGHSIIYGVAIACLWGCIALQGVLAPLMTRYFSYNTIFMMLLVIGIVSYVLLSPFMIETKGKTAMQIKQEYVSFKYRICGNI
jgi:hypothetical protein